MATIRTRRKTKLSDMNEQAEADSHLRPMSRKKEFVDLVKNGVDLAKKKIDSSKGRKKSSSQ